MENSPESDVCCVICLKTSNDSHLLPVVNITADAINKHLDQLYNIEIVNAGSGDHRICVSCFDTVEKAAKVKDCFRDRETIFKKTSEKVQDPNQDPVGLTITNTNEISANKSPGRLKTTQSELMCVEIGSTAEYEKQRAGAEIEPNESHCYGRRLELPDENDRLKRGRADDEKPAPDPNVEKENIEDNLERSPEKLSENVGEAVPSNEAKVHDDDDIKMMVIAGDDTGSSITEDFYEEHDDHAPEIEVCNADALDDFLNNNVVEDSKSGGSSKEFAQAGLQQSKTDEQLRSRSLSCDLKSESEVESGPAMHDDDTSLDYVADFEDSAAGASTSRFSMLTRSRRSQRESNLRCTVDPNPYQLLMSDKFFECDYCPKVFYYKYTLLKHLMVHINYQQPYRCDKAGCTKSYSTKRSLTRHHSDCHTDKLTTREPAMKQLQERKKVPNKCLYACSYEGCQKSYNTRKTLIWHQKRIHTGPRLTSVNQQQQSECALTDPTMHVYTVLTSAGNEIGRVEEPQASTSMVWNQYTEPLDFVQSMSSFSSVSEISKSRGSFMCCKEDFATSQNKLKHLETAHADRKQVCGDCGKVFYQTKEFNSHMKDHTNIRPFRCTFEGCIKSYDSASVLADHKRKKNHTDYRFKCCCGFQALSQPGFDVHQRKCSVGNSKKIKSEKQAESSSSAKQKVETKAEGKVELPRFRCNFQGCDELFVTSAELNQHAFVHAENSERVESLPFSTATVKAPPTFECLCGYKTQDLGEFMKHYEVGCPR